MGLVTITVTDNYGYSNNFTVHINDMAGGNYTINVNDPLFAPVTLVGNYSGSYGSGYLWVIPPSTIVNSNTITVSTQASYIFEFQVFGGNLVQVIMNNLPVADPQLEMTINGDPYTPSSTYTLATAGQAWTVNMSFVTPPNTLAPINTIFNPPSPITGNGAYNQTVECDALYMIGSNLRTFSDPSKVIIVDPPLALNISGTLNGNPDTSLICGNTVGINQTDVVVLTANPSGGDGTAYVYQWTRNSVVVSSAANVTIDTSSSPLAYQITVWNISDPSTTVTCTINFVVRTVPPLTASIQWGSQTITCGDTIVVTPTDPQTITAMATGGVTPYNYYWTLPDSSTSTNQSVAISQLGTYTVIIEDSDVPVARDTCTIVITNQLTLQLVLNDNPISCGGTGTIISGSTNTLSANASGGITPYTYLWTLPDSSTSSNATINPTLAGTYSVTVTDSTNPSQTVSCSVTIVIVSQLALQLVLNGNPISCGGTGTIISGTTNTLIATASGGTSPYTYSWILPDGSITSNPTIHPTVAGEYTVTVTDSTDPIQTVSCSVTLVLVSQLAVQLNLNGNPISCGGTGILTGSTNTLAATVTGGTPPYTYLWTLPDSSTSSNSSINPTIIGTYNLIVTDSTIPYQTVSCTVTLTNVNPLSLQLTFNNNSINCGGTGTLLSGSTNTLTVNLSGGTPPYTYLWTLPNGSTSSNSTINPTVAGTYSVIASDSSDPSQTVSCSITLTEQTPTTVITTIFVGSERVNCGGCICVDNAYFNLNANIVAYNNNGNPINYALYMNGGFVTSGTLVLTLSPYDNSASGNINFGYQCLNSVSSVLELVISNNSNILNDCVITVQRQTGCCNSAYPYCQYYENQNCEESDSSDCDCHYVYY